MRRPVAAAAAALAALALPAAALAHVEVTPDFLADGTRGTLTFSSPNERPRHAITAFTLAAPPGVRLASAAAPPGWRLTVSGRTAVWQGGRVGPGQTGAFSVNATASSAPGTVRFHAVQRYDDGAKVNWVVALTVLPATKTPQQHLLPALVTAALGLLAIALLLARTRGRQRRPLRGR